MRYLMCCMLLMLTVCFGCGSEPVTNSQKEAGVSLLLPNNARDIKHLSSESGIYNEYWIDYGWFVYKLDYEDSTYTILHKVSYGSHGEKSSAFTVLKVETKVTND